MRTRGLYRFLLLGGIMSGIGLVPVPSWAQTIQPPSAFDITVDGFFTDPNEWSDVAPIEFVFSDGSAFTYTVVGPKRDSLYLMYDATNKTNDFIGTGAAGTVEFNVGVPPPTPGPCPPPAGGHHYVVSFFAFGIVVLQDGCFFDVTGIMEGARFFGTSPNSATPHRMFELEVAFDCQDPTLNCPPVPGVYSPAPSFWGATVSNTNEPAHCEQAQSSDCNAPPPVEVPCQTPGAFQVFGDPVSAACTEVMPGTGGVTRITKIHLPSETTITPFCFGDGTSAPCPCLGVGGSSNGAPGNGCSNSVNPLGANLAGSGSPIVSADTLTLSATGMRPSTLCLFIQGDAEVNSLVYGDGLRCFSGHLLRLFRFTPHSGSATVPSASSTPPNMSISARAAALGSPITNGTYVYQVWYRDPVEPFACDENAPTFATFNVTNGVRVLWSM